MISMISMHYNKKASTSKQVIINAIKKISQGVLSTLVDVIIMESVVWYEFLSNPIPMARTTGGLNYVKGVIDEKSYRKAFENAKQRGWIDKEFRPTKKGKARLESVLNICFEKPSKWDKKWYIVVFDVPEHKRQIRDVLRNKLKALGFGMLQASVWISPYPCLGDVEEIVKLYNLKPYVLYAVSKKVGRYNAKELAGKVWELKNINKKYKQFLEKHKKFEKEFRVEDLNKLKFSYLSILQIDPQLPKGLLPDDWAGDKAYKIFRKLLKLILK